MAKTKNKTQGRITYVWIETPEGYCPRIQVGDLLIQLEPRPSRTFILHERESCIFHLGNLIGEKLFGCLRFLPNDQGLVVENPQWDELDVLVPEEPEPEPEPETVPDGEGGSMELAKGDEGETTDANVVGLDGKPVS